ncbi:MAG: glycosyltransferase [Burkholderiales bacterium]|nr:glycosyltransferase [Burkholderiales bacterium]
MSSIPWLTVMIPFHNVRPYLRGCVQSVLDQADGGVELLLLDDGSDDGSARELAGVVSAGRARLLSRATRGGLAAARNTLLDHAQGRYHWFVDGDDWLAPQAMARLRSILQRWSPDLVMCDYRMHVEHRGLLHRLRREGHRSTFGGTPHRLISSREELLAGMLRRHQFQMWNKVVRRELWSDRGRFPALGTLSDVRPSLALALTARSLYYHPEAWVHYRRTGRSVLATTAAIDRADNRAHCLDGLKSRFGEELARLDPPSRYLLASLAAGHFVQSARRAWRHEGVAAADRLRRYRLTLERESPIPPDALPALHRARGRWRAAWVLRRWLSRAA